ncbi:MAG: radical SAM protein [Bacteriovoracaceae bacterium]|nr:radical SAM protein [Bacteriovoracaceae bacterium]
MNKLKWNLYSKIVLNNLSTPPGPGVFFNLLSSWIEHKMGRSNLLSSPSSAVLYINKTCNYTCGFCYNKDVLNVEPLEENLFTVTDLNEFLQSDHGKNVLRIALMGGEPFINKNIFDLIRICKENHKIVNIVSNGSLIKDDYIPKIKSSRLDAIGLSLYDNNPDHIERLSRQFNHFNINYWVQTVIDGTNLESLEEKLDFASKASIKNFIISNYNPYFDDMFSKSIRSGNNDYTLKINELSKKYSKEMNITWPTILPISKNASGRPTKKCTLPFSYIHLDSSGTIAPCCYRYPKIEYGNLYKNDGWNSPFNKKLRENMYSDDEPIGECKDCENLYRNLYF